MGRLNSLVKQAIASRVKLMSQSEGSLGSGLLSQDRPIAPLLQGDFVLRFISKGNTYDSTDFLLTGLSGLGSPLSWSAHGSVYGVPVPSVQTDYLSVTFYISGDYNSASVSFPSLLLYDAQFTSDGLLRLPVERTFTTRDSYMALHTKRDTAFDSLDFDAYVEADAALESFSMADASTEVFGSSSDSTLPRYNRPTIQLIALCPDSDLVSADKELVLCEFTGCVFGTPTPSPNPSGVSPMSFTQQIGYRFITWPVNSLLNPSRQRNIGVYPMVKSAR